MAQPGAWSGKGAGKWSSSSPGWSQGSKGSPIGGCGGWSQGNLRNCGGGTSGWGQGPSNGGDSYAGCGASCGSSTGGFGSDRQSQKAIGAREPKSNNGWNQASAQGGGSGWNEWSHGSESGWNQYEGDPGAGADDFYSTNQGSSQNTRQSSEQGGAHNGVGRAAHPAALSAQGAARAEGGGPLGGASSTAISLTVSGCQHKTIDRILNGTFVLTGEKFHGFPVYKKTEQVSGLDIMLYYWDLRDGPSVSGWWFGPQVAGDQVWGYHPESGNGTPPFSGWRVPCDGDIDPMFRVAPQSQWSRGAPEAAAGGKGAGHRKASQGQQPQSAETATPDPRALHDARIEEERKRAEEANRKRIEEERRRADEANQRRIEEEQRRADEANRKRIEEEQRRADERKRIEEEKRRADEANRKRVEEFQRRQEEQREKLQRQREMHRKKQQELQELQRRKEEELRQAQEAKRRAEEEAKRKAEEDARKQREEMERKRREEEQRKLEEQRKKMEDMRKKAEEEQQRKKAEQQRKIEEQKKKMEDARKEVERQRELKAEEIRLKKEQAEKKANELKAAGTVRRMIQKVRVASLDTFDGLKQELEDTLEQEMESLGSMQEALQEECEKALDLARKRLDQLEEQRQKAAEKKQQEERDRRMREERTRELIGELEGLVDTAEARNLSVTQAMEHFSNQGPEGSIETVQASIDSVESAFSEAKAATKACADFVVTNKAELKEPEQKAQPPMPGAAEAAAEIKAKLKALLDRIKEYNASNEASIAKVREAHAGLARRSLALKKMRFKKALFKTYDEDSDGMLSREEILSYAKGEYEFEVPEASLDAIMKHNADTGQGVPFAKFFWVNMAIGVARELQRDQKRQSDKAVKQEELVTYKMQLQDQIKEGIAVVEKAEKAVVDCEKNVKELKAKVKTDLAEDLITASSISDAMAEVARTAVADARAHLDGIRNGLSEDHRQNLQSWLSSEVKKSEIRLGRMDARIGRVDTLCRQVRDDATKRKMREVSRLRSTALKVIRYNMMSRRKDTVNDMFAEMDANGDGVLDEQEFIAFFKEADKTIKDLPMMVSCDDAEGGSAHETGMDEETVDAAKAEDTGDAKDAAEGGPAEQDTGDAKDAAEGGPAEQGTGDAKDAAEGAPAEQDTGDAKDAAEGGPAEQDTGGAMDVAEGGPAEQDTGDAKDVAETQEEPAQDGAGPKLADAEEVVEISSDEVKQVFAHLCNQETTLSKDAFELFMRFYMRVVEEATLTSGMRSKGGQVVRQLAPKEVVEVLQGPLKEDASGLKRVEARAFKDDARGWVTVSDSRGSVWLREGGHVFKVVKETILTDSFAISVPKEATRKLRQTTRKLKAGEFLEMLEWPAKEEASGLTRAKVRALSDGEVGFATAMGNQGTMFIDLV